MKTDLHQSPYLLSAYTFFASVVQVPDFYYEKLLYHFCDSILTVSQSTKNILVNMYDVEPDKINIVGNFCSFSEPDIVLEREKNSLLFIGRLDARKNPIFTLSLVDSLLKLGHRYSLHIVGNGHLLSRCQEFVSDKKLNPYVHFYENVTEYEKNVLMKRCGFLIVPSIFEGQGIVCLEGISAGMCVLVNNTDGLRDVCCASNRFNSLEEAVGILARLGSDDQEYALAVQKNRAFVLTTDNFDKQLLSTYFHVK